MRALALLACVAACTPVERHFFVRLPAHHDPSRAAPLLVLLHPLYPGDGERAVAMYDLGPLADARGLIIVAPDGTLGPSGMRSWNASAACCAEGLRPPDDVVFLTGLVRKLRVQYRVDDKRVFVLGYSNGGYMAHRLACDAPELFAGSVSMAGAAGGERGCMPKQPLALLEIHGDADERVPYRGDPQRSVPSAHAGVGRFAIAIGCGAPAPAKPAGDLLVEEWPCRAGAAALWTVPGGGHRGLATPQLLGAALDWLLAHPRP